MNSCVQWNPVYVVPIDQNTGTQLEVLVMTQERYFFLGGGGGGLKKMNPLDAVQAQTLSVSSPIKIGKTCCCASIPITTSPDPLPRPAPTSAERTRSRSTGRNASIHRRDLTLLFIYTCIRVLIYWMGPGI